jgi:calcium-dependent protein kinase
MQLQKATLTYITSHLSSAKDKEGLTRIFQVLDKNGDGKLSKEELKDGYLKFFGIDIPSEDIEHIMLNIDVDKNGYVDYTEFAMAASSRQVILSEEKLKRAFRMFDIV